MPEIEEQVTQGRVRHLGVFRSDEILAIQGPSAVRAQFRSIKIDVSEGSGMPDDHQRSHSKSDSERTESC